MSPRNKLLRKVVNPPVIKGFKPYGPEGNQGKMAVVNLYYEEYEALRLCDYDMFNHQQASEIMGISRPTFTRVYAAARQKIAQALVEGRQIAIEGGKVYFDSDWYTCDSCGCFFNNPRKDQKMESCPLCGKCQVRIIGEEVHPSPEEEQAGESPDQCICPQCGFESVHRQGEPCSRLVCPFCKEHMKRQSVPGGCQAAGSPGGKQHCKN